MELNNFQTFNNLVFCFCFLPLKKNSMGFRFCVISVFCFFQEIADGWMDNIDWVKVKHLAPNDKDKKRPFQVYLNIKDYVFHFHLNIMLFNSIQFNSSYYIPELKVYDPQRSLENEYFSS